MKQEDKDLLIKDLCSRLPYGVKVRGNYSYSDGDKIIDDIQTKVLDIYDIDWVINNIEIKPYLFPLSSMTEEQEEEYNDLNGYELGCFPHTEEALDYLIKNHFDYRGLIPKGLAIDCTNLNIY
jgi:hypothetical protein